MTEGYSLSDVAAVTGRNNENDGFGGNGSWWIIVLFIFALCGWGGNWGGAGNGGGSAVQGALTRGDLCMDMNFQEVKRDVQNANDAVNLGFANLNSTICNQQYDTARMINGLQGTVQNGFNSTNVALLQGQNALATQIANCCCENREGQAQINYNLATQSCDTRQTIQNVGRDIIDSQNAGVNAILGKLTQQETEAKNAQIAVLNQQLFTAQLAASQAAQNNYIISQLRPQPVPAFSVPNPFAAYSAPFGCGCNTGCACG